MTSNLNSTVVSHTYLHIILHDYLSCPLFCPISENGHLGNKDLLLNISFCYCSSAEMFLHWLPKTSTVPMTKIFFSSYFSSDPVNDRSSWNFPFPGCYSWLTLLLLTFSFSFFAPQPNIGISDTQQLKKKRAVLYVLILTRFPK